jgi:hypothetical protein
MLSAAICRNADGNSWASGAMDFWLDKRASFLSRTRFSQLLQPKETVATFERGEPCRRKLQSLCPSSSSNIRHLRARKFGAKGQRIFSSEIPNRRCSFRDRVRRNKSIVCAYMYIDTHVYTCLLRSIMHADR